jgi:hypothetical protein
VPKVFEQIRRGPTAITIAAGSYRLVKVPIATEARLARVVVRQLDATREAGGVAVAFTVDVLSSAVGMVADTDIPNATLLPDDIDLFKVLDATLAGTSGNAAKSVTANDGFVYKNADSPSQTVREYFLYLLIRPTAAATATLWKYCLTCFQDVGSG